MKNLRLYFALAATVSFFGCAEPRHNKGLTSSNAKDSSFLSVHGKTIDDSSDQVTFWVTLQLSDHSWQAGEIGATSKVFVTKRGVWVYQPSPTGATLLQSPDGAKNIASLTGLNPDTVKKADTGRFYSEEKARVGTWDLLK